MALIGYLIRACAGTAAPSCSVERNSTRFLLASAKISGPLLRRTAGGSPRGRRCRQHPGTEICIPLHCGEAKIGDATFPETAFRVTLLGLRLLSNCYQSSHFHGCGAML